MDTPMPIEIRRQHARLTQQLVEEFEDRIPADVIVRRATDRLQQYRNARVLTFVPTLVYRHTRDELRAQEEENTRAA